MNQSTLQDFESSGVECEYCDREFDTSQARNSHVGQTHPDEVKTTVDCVVCGDSFEVYTSKAERRKCCSQNCHGELKSDKYSGEGHPSYQNNDVECDYCGETFHRRPSHVSDRNFCDWECKCRWQEEYKTGENANAWNGGKVALECEWCEDEFNVDPNMSPQRFCSRKCHGKWRSRNIRGNNHWLFQGGREIANALRNQIGGKGWDKRREEASKQLPDRCEICHSKSRTRSLDVHHIIPLVCGGDNGMYNLMAVCASCHRKVESYTKSIPEVPNIIQKFAND